MPLGVFVQYTRPTLLKLVKNVGFGTMTKPLKRNICVKAKECTGLAWEGCRTVIDAKNVPLVKERTFSIWGTTLYPQKSVETKM